MGSLAALSTQPTREINSTPLSPAKRGASAGTTNPFPPALSPLGFCAPAHLSLPCSWLPGWAGEAFPHTSSDHSTIILRGCSSPKCSLDPDRRDPSLLTAQSISVRGGFRQISVNHCASPPARPSLAPYCNRLASPRWNNRSQPLAGDPLATF